MIAAIALSSLLGTWVCTYEDAPKLRVRYILRADRTGALISHFAGDPARYRIVRHFNYKLTGGDLIEHFTDPQQTGLIERHSVRLTGQHLVDETHVYWHENGWTPVPTPTILNCQR